MGLTNEEIVDRFIAAGPTKNPDFCIYKVVYHEINGNHLRCADCTSRICIFSGNYESQRKGV